MIVREEMYSSLGGEIRAMLRLAVPVVVIQLGLMAMGVVDTIMVGHFTVRALAAVALGSFYFITVTVFGMGLLMALDPIVAQAVGAGDDRAVARGTQRGMLLAVLLTVFSTLLLMPSAPVLTFLRQPEDIVPIAASYVWVSIPGVFPFFAFVVLRQSLQAMRRVRPVVVTILAANVANIFLNWILIFGKLGAPALGAVGSGWASTISRWLMAVALLAMAWQPLRRFLVPPYEDAVRLSAIVRMIRLGAPIGAQLQLEFGAFGVIALLMGWMGALEMAAHQVAISLASFMFMVPVGVSAAAAVLVGHAVGRADRPGVRRAAEAALICGGVFMAFSAVLLLTVPESLALLYTNDVPVAVLAAILIPIAGIFQVFDGLQVVSVGILRGLGDTTAPMVISVMGFWLIGLPIALYLGFATGLGPVGLWWGLVAGLLAVAIFLLTRVRAQLAREVRRVVIDDDEVGGDYAT